MADETTTPLRSGQYVDTGMGGTRRRLTLEEAEAGCLPIPFTQEEWARLYCASEGLTVPADLHVRRVNAHEVEITSPRTTQRKRLLRICARPRMIRRAELL